MPCIVSAPSSHTKLVVGQVKADEKSNEITAIPELLDLLYVRGAIVTIDAVGCQKKIVRKILKRGAGYVDRRVGHSPGRNGGLSGRDAVIPCLLFFPW